MVDDLFEDFDLKTSNESMKNTENTEVEPPPAEEEISSQQLHPDIFSQNDDANNDLSEDEIRILAEKIDSENAEKEKDFRFRDAEKTPVSEFTIVNDSALEIEERTIDKVKRPAIKLDPDNFGDTFRRLREAACLSVQNLADELRLKESTIIALENEDYDNLPPEVYVVAYIRRLGGIYHLTEEEIVALSRKVRARMEIELPEDMDKVVTIYEPSEENDKKLRHIFFLFMTILVVALILIGAGIYFFVSGKDSQKDPAMPPPGKNEHFSPEMLIKLQPEVKLDIPPLRIKD